MTVTVTTALSKPSLKVYLDNTGSNGHVYTTVDQDSSSGTDVLYVASTTDMEVGMRLNIDPTGAGGGQEYGVIESIDAGVSVTLVDNLTYTHTAAAADGVTLTVFYVVQTRDSASLFSISSLTRLSSFSDEASVTFTSANRTALPFIDPTEDANVVAYALGRSWESGNFTIRDTACWFYDNSPLNNTRSNIGSTTVNVDSASGTAVLNVVTNSNFTNGKPIIIGWGTAREEVAIVNSSTSTTLNLDRNLAFTHTAAQADPVYEGLGVDDGKDA